MVCSKFWKLDKIDKIVISLIFVFFTMYSIFNCFCFASVPLEPIDSGSGLFINANSSKVVSDSSGFYLVFNFSERGTYKFLTKVDVITGFSNSLPEVGDIVSNVRHYAPNSTFTIEISEPNTLVYFTTTAHSDIYNSKLVFVDFVPYNGFKTIISDLSYNVGFLNIWGGFEKSLSFVLVVVLFAFGWWFFAHWVKELSKGREF